MKKHNREQENSKPEKHSWFKSKKDVNEEVEEEISEAVEEESETVEDVSETVEEVTEPAEEVTESTEEVTEATEEVTEAVEETVEVTEETAEAIEEVAEEATEVVEEAAEGAESEVSSESVAVEELLETKTEEASAIAPAAAIAELFAEGKAPVAEEKVVKEAEEVTEEVAEEEVSEEEVAEEETSEEEKSEEEDSKEEDSKDEKSEEGDEETDEESEESEEEEEDDEVDEKAKKKDKEESQKEKSALYMFFDTIKFVSIGLLIGILLVVFVIQRNDVYGSSMEPTLYSGDAVFVEMISVYTGNFDRGDIITIDAKGMEGYSHDENLIKRIVGLPGETIKIADGNVYINGQLLDESDYLPAGTKTYVGAEGQSRGYDEITLGPDEYYCMGDNRGGSNDSRRMGPFKKSQIDAKVLARIYPFNKMKFF